MSRIYSITSPPDAASTPPAGVVPDFQDAYTLRPYWNVTISLGVFTTSIMLFLRMYTKIVIVKKCRWEDYTCALGFVFLIVNVVLTQKVVDSKMGFHQWNITSHDLAEQNRWTNYAGMVYPLSLGFTKLSIVLLIMRIFCPQRADPLYRGLQGLMFMISIFYIIYFFISIFQCSPREKIWQPEIPGSCLKVYPAYIASASFNVLSDLALYFVPMWKIWHLQMPRGQKLGLSAIFAAGSIAIASSVARLVFDVISIYRTDLSYLSMQTSLLSLTEEFCGVICSCLFILPRLYRHLTSSSTYHQQGYMLRQYKMVKPPLVETPKSSGGAPLAEFTYGSDGAPDDVPSWDRGIEAPTTLPCQAHHSAREIEVCKEWQVQSEQAANKSGANDTDVAFEQRIV